MNSTAYFSKIHALWLLVLTGILAGPIQAGEMRAWGPEQATGAPNTEGPGDLQTAWASRTEDSGDEWLQLEYVDAVEPAKLRVFETFNPGAVVKIASVEDSGNEDVLWQGADPLRNGSASGVAEFALRSASSTNRIKLYLASGEVTGWNEIDAVELIAKDGTRQWAHVASASSTYAEQNSEATDDGQTDEFSPYLNQSVMALMDGGTKVHGLLLTSGKDFLVVRAHVSNHILMLNKRSVHTVEIDASRP